MSQDGEGLIFKGIIAAQIVIGLVSLGIVGGVIYAAWHFISKFW